MMMGLCGSLDSGLMSFLSRLLPSNARASGTPRSHASMMVGMMSMWAAMLVLIFLLCLILAGQCIQSGERIPPSWMFDFFPLNGPV